jgi:sortase A
MKSWAKVLRVVERSLLWLGLLFLATFSFAYIHRLVMFHAEMARFESKQLEYAKERRKGQLITQVQDDVGHPTQTMNANYPLWSVQRTKLDQASLSKRAETLAVLRIPRLQLEVPVLEGTDELTLNRGVGRIIGTSRPGEIGNIGIAGHRDGFFRPLKDIREGDLIELVTASGTEVYGVDRLRITSPADVSTLSLKSTPSLTLVTCYPFYFVGPAPNRYIIEASLKQSIDPGLGVDVTAARKEGTK